ncbi:S-adenosyl-L-methionine:benzoic acid/salicylic acid carboxyl methyltransferase 3-like [Arachis duranensis]|uniref:S-adenosyl-L-methionine:benzoic acid/salicylic acid carboxyl methyltransferase 3-like n=1 Tax=Arachis duranensis TaxID=130453 RepID=A0A6P5N8E7_ARADU|nr:S-adenosyl-L-methionine:benzoic acid/salicylic acid carboxyl methyltransferase 3-like [Arachis duranensis]
MATKKAPHLDGGMDTQQVLHMNDGIGDNSYANNSLLQKKVMMKAKPILEENMMRLYSIIHPQCFVVADLGCSSGPNTLYLLSNVINIIDTVTCKLNLKLPVFQFFLNDLFGNDFNSIIKSLPQFLESLEENKGHNFGPCFINATPGSFYKRLFPDNSIHLVHSSYSLHWLSKAPKELVNKENAHLTSTSPPGMHKAYLEQFQKDFKLFLKLRSQEVVAGGGMVLTLFGRDKTCDIRTAWTIIGTTLNDMVLENLIEEIKLESFNLPLYDPTIEEAKEVIEDEGSFTLQRLESVVLGWDANINEDVDDEKNKLDLNKRAQFITKYTRAATEPLLKTQFGEQVMDEFFLRFKNKIFQLMMDVEILEFPNLIISLIKNA